MSLALGSWARGLSTATSVRPFSSTAFSRTERGEHLRQAVDEVEMALAGVEGRLAVGNDRGQVASHRDGCVGVLLSVREVHRRLDVFEAKPPRPGVEAHLPCRPSAAVAERLCESLREDLP